MPLLYTDTYNTKLLELNPNLVHLFVESHANKGGEPAVVKLRNKDGSLPLTLRDNYTESGYLRSETEARDIVLIEDQVQLMTHSLRMGVTVCVPTIPLNEELSHLKKYTPKVEQYLLKRLNLIKEAFPLQGL